METDIPDAVNAGTSTPSDGNIDLQQQDPSYTSLVISASEGAITERAGASMATTSIHTDQLVQEDDQSLVKLCSLRPLLISPRLNITRGYGGSGLTSRSDNYISAHLELHSTAEEPDSHNLKRRGAEESNLAEQGAAAEKEECKTPTAREQRIPSEPTVCPPAPKKKKSAYKRVKRTRHSHAAINLIEASTNSADNIHHHRALFGSPPDLHTFPECIKALFK